MSVVLAIYLPDGEEAGKILRIVKCSETLASIQARSGEAVYEIPRGFIVTDISHYIDLDGDEPVLAEVP